MIADPALLIQGCRVLSLSSRKNSLILAEIQGEESS